ncbi:hypothetical protein [Streptomyces sp. NBC_00310]|uniref:hypothetical protein n=1 Tax=Streptomyces sp. NBC_00310 TaxID=2903645 RepID=UPI003FA77273
MTDQQTTTDGEGPTVDQRQAPPAGRQTTAQAPAIPAETPTAVQDQPAAVDQQAAPDAQSAAVPVQAHSAADAQDTAASVQKQPTPQPSDAVPPASAFSVPEPPLLPPSPLPTASPVKKDRRALRAVLRWTAAVVVFAAVGTAAVTGVIGMERTDVPGLATESDGRWEYPTLTKPVLPSGSPGPFAETNKAGTHHADLRDLVLPAPKGAKPDTVLGGADGWLPTKDFLAEFAPEDDAVDELDQVFTDYGLRHIAARGWTTPDGTRTRIYLLQFNTAVVADEVFSVELTGYGSPRYDLRGIDGTVSRDEDFPVRSELLDIERAAYVESKPYGEEQVRQAYLSAADTLAVVVQSRKGATEAIPFQQTVVLQSQLLD